MGLPDFHYKRASDKIGKGKFVKKNLTRIPLRLLPAADLGNIIGTTYQLKKKKKHETMNWQEIEM